jgi:hypothetical protein
MDHYPVLLEEKPLQAHQLPDPFVLPSWYSFSYSKNVTVSPNVRRRHIELQFYGFNGSIKFDYTKDVLVYYITTSYKGLFVLLMTMKAKYRDGSVSVSN